MKKYFLTIFAVCSGTLEMTLQCMCKDLEHTIVQQCCILYTLVFYIYVLCVSFMLVCVTY